MEKHSRISAFTELKEFDHFAKQNDFLEVTFWHNGEGFDANINSARDQMICLTWGEYKALKKVIKFLQKKVVSDEKKNEKEHSKNMQGL